MKKLTKILLIVLMIATCVFAVTACNDQNKGPDLTIKNVELAQTTIVKGNDINLAAGKLSYLKEGVLQELALNAEGVKVTGFDKFTVGKQTLTVSYGGSSKTVDVDVVERMTFQNCALEYVQGEAFNSKGTVTVVNDDGTDFSLFLRDEKFKVTGFNALTAGEQTLVVNYKDGETEYSGNFAVTVYAPEKISFGQPTKVQYESHEALDVSDAYFTIVAKNGVINRSIPVDESLVSGFDASVVTNENPTVIQTVTVAYPNKNFTFKVQITLSDVTRIKRAAETLASLDWSGNQPSAVTAAQGTLAMDALGRYLNLKSEKAKLISAEEITSVLRAAAVYGRGVWTAKAEQFEDLFIATGGVAFINCEDHSKTKTALTAISALENNDVLYTYGDVLSGAASSEDFANVTLYGEVKASDYLTSVCNAQSIKDAIKKIDLMLKMHEALKNVPAEWQFSDLAAHATEIEAAKEQVVKLAEITEGIYERYIFNTVSEWRAQNKNDYFEILYSYYFDMYENGADEETREKGWNAIGDLIDVCMPGELETYYMSHINALLEQYDIKYTLSETQFIPSANINTLSFVAAYRRLIAARDAVLETNKDMYLTIYYHLNLGQLVTSIQDGDFGIFALLGSACGDPAFEAMWTTYIDVVAKLLNSNSNLSADETAELLEGLFKDFIALTPELQKQFIASVNSYGTPELYPSDGTDRPTYFSGLITAYYMDIMPKNLIGTDEESGIVFDLFDALQFYILRNETLEDAEMSFFDAFLETMGKVETAYGKLSASDKTVFDKHIGFFYEKYLHIYKLYDANGDFVENQFATEWQEKVDDLKLMYQSLGNLFQSVMFSDYTQAPVFIAFYEYAASVYNDIMTNAPQDVKDYLTCAGMDLFEGENATIESYKYQYRLLLRTYMLQYRVDDEYAISIWNEYEATDLNEFMAYVSDFFAITLSEDSELTLAQVKDVMARFRNLTNDEKAIFVALDGDGTFVFFKALRAFFAKALAESEAAKAAATELINLEIGWVNMTNSDFIAAFEAFDATYQALGEADKTLFDANLKEVYDYYKAKYDEIKANSAN